MKRLWLFCGAAFFASVCWSQTTADALFTQGIAAAKAGQLEAAARLFDQGRQAYPQDPRFPIERAGIAYLQKQNAAAKSWLLRGLKLAPDDAYANEFLGTLYQIDGNLPATLKYWNRIGAPVLSDVVFRPQTGMDPAFRARLLAFSGGQTLTEARLRLTQANLLRANVLAGVRIDLLPAANKQYQAFVDMQPKTVPLTGWPGRLLPLLRGLPYQTVDVDAYDIAGRGGNFTSLWRWDPDKRRLALEWSVPVEGNPRSEYHAWIDARDELWDLRSSYTAGTNGLAVRSLSAGADYVHGLTSKLQWTLGGTLARHTFGAGKPDDSALFTNAWTATIDDRLDYDLWSVPEHRLSVQTWGLLDVGRVFRPDDASRLVVARGGLRGEWLPQASGERYRLSSQVQAGRITGDVPVDDIFQLGMERDVESDLWLRGLKSAAHGRKGTGLLGREYALSQTTFERQLFHIAFISLALGPFFDAGWVSDPDPALTQRGTVCAAGLQATLKSIGGIGVALVYGRDLSSGRGAFYTATSR